MTIYRVINTSTNEIAAVYFSAHMHELADKLCAALRDEDRRQGEPRADAWKVVTIEGSFDARDGGADDEADQQPPRSRT